MEKADMARTDAEWTFDPWNLDEDVEFEGLRLLILGESHYDDGEKPETDPVVIAKETRWVVETCAFARNRSSQRFFPYIFETVTDEKWEAGSPKVKAFWNHVYFHNYVQEFVATSARKAPTAAMFGRSEAPFFAVLKRLKPDAVLVMGERLWGAMADGDLGPDLRDGVGQTYWFKVDDQHRALAARIKHPSSAGFSPRHWHAPVKEFLDLCRSEKRSLSS